MDQRKQYELNAKLHEASYLGQNAAVDAALRSGADIHSDFEKAMRDAARGGRAQTVLHLWMRGADFEDALAMSAYSADEHALKNLIAAGENTKTIKCLRKVFTELASNEGIPNSIGMCKSTRAPKKTRSKPGAR